MKILRSVARSCVRRMRRRSLNARVRKYFGNSRALTVRERALSEHIRRLDAACEYAPHGGARFEWPVSGPIRSPYGERFGRMHHGVDLAVPAGTPIRAAAEGCVLSAEWMPEYGNTIVVSHGHGFTTVYAHQSELSVGVGDIVHGGQPIGLVGATGRVTGPHLHFEIRVGATPQDPAAIIETPPH